MIPQKINWSNILEEIRYKGYSDEAIAQASGWKQRRVYDVRIAKKYATGVLIVPPEEFQEKIMALHRFVKDLPHKELIRGYAVKTGKKVSMIKTIAGFQV